VHDDSAKTYIKEYTPSTPGMYSIILEVNDRANNSIYVRRFALFDPQSQITIDQDDNLYSNSSSFDTSYLWQTVVGNGTNGNTDVHIVWRNHFANKFHKDNFLLNEVLTYPPQLDDGGRRGQGYKHISLDDNEGKRSKTAISNTNGITKYEIVAKKDNDGGRTFKNTPESGWKELSAITENVVLSIPGIEDGNSAKVFVRATDAMGNTKVDSTLVHFDSSNPIIAEPAKIENNVANGKFPFSSR